MQSKPSKNRNGRSANQAEKDFHKWQSERPCCWCGCESGSIIDHVVGAKTGHNKEHIGHWFTLPNCAACDDKKTRLGEKLGDYSNKWAGEIADYHQESNGKMPSEAIWESIMDWGNRWRNGK